MAHACGLTISEGRTIASLPLVMATQYSCFVFRYNVSASGGSLNEGKLRNWETIMLPPPESRYYFSPIKIQSRQAEDNSHYSPPNGLSDLPRSRDLIYIQIKLAITAKPASVPTRLDVPILWNLYGHILKHTLTSRSKGKCSEGV